MIATAAGPLLKLLDALRCFGFGESGIELLAGFAAERFQIGPLSPGHRLIAGHPLFGILLSIVPGRGGIDVFRLVHGTSANAWLAAGRSTFLFSFCSKRFPPPPDRRACPGHPA